MDNILNKTDKSYRPKDKRTKSDIFKWASTDSRPGEFMKISKDSLYVDGAYQRQSVSEEKVRKIAREWDWLLFGTISIVSREPETSDNEPSFVVFDGGHRVRASFYRNDVNLLPCMVHAVESICGEAKAFFARNTTTSNMSPVDRHRASTCAGEPTAINTNAILKELGIEIAKSGSSGERKLRCLASAVRIVGIDARIAKECLSFCNDLNRDKQISATILNGVFMLCRIFPDGLIQSKFNRLGKRSQGEIEQAIRIFRTETGVGGAASSAKAILRLLNKSVQRSHKLVWPER